MLDFETEAILLRRIEYGDHDVIITFMTKDRGKITVMARNAKRASDDFPDPWICFPLTIFSAGFPRKKKTR